MKIGRWSTTAGNNNSTPPDGWPENQAPSTVNDCAREMMASIRTAFNDLQYFDQDFTPTYVSATSFTVPGDQTSAIHAGRRLKLYDATAGVATTIYATVLTASFTAVTTISISADAGQLTTSLSSFALAILSQNNDSAPNNKYVRGTLTASGAVTLLSTLSVSAATALGTTLSVSGNTALKGNVLIEGTTTLSGAVVINTTLSLSGAATFNSTLTVSGAATFKRSLSVSGTVVAANVCKAWGNFDGKGVAALRVGFNIASFSESATGIFRITFSTAMSTVDYAAVLMAFDTAAPGGRVIQSVSATTTTYKFTTAAVGGSISGSDTITAIFYAP